MYIPQHFAENDPAWMHAAIRRDPFATITSLVDGALMATHLPFLIEPGEGQPEGTLGTLHAHMARQNPHWKSFDGTQEALVVFAGPHGYISPTWYEKPSPAVPTWNYVAVHVYGKPVIVDEPDRTRAHLAHLADTFEGEGPHRWSMADQPDSFIDGMLRGVVSFAVPITRIEGKAKMSQNRPLEDRNRVIAALRARGETALADAMDAVKT
jgi:transcriptional regulator